MTVNVPPPENPEVPGDGRWPFIRNVLVFMFKLALGNLQNYLLGPIAFGAALIDLLFKHPARRGERFYRVLEIGREVDEGINIYGAVGGYHATGAAPSAEAAASPGPVAGGVGARTGAAVDTVVRRVEEVIVREYRKGGTAASVKAAVDRLLDEILRESKK